MSTTSNFNTVRVLSKSEFENNFSSTSDDTLYFVEMDNTMFDGQWVAKIQTLSTATAVGTYTIDLSDYLPNDTYNYEVNLNVLYRYSGSNSKGSVLTINNVGYCINNQGNGSRTNRTIFYYDTQKQFTFTIKGVNATSNQIIAVAYRRIGTNA